MRFRLKRVWVTAACGLLLVSLAVAPGRADQTSKLEQIRSERAQLLERIEQHESEATSLEDRVDALNDSMIELRSALAELDADLVQIESRVRSAQAQIDETQARMDRIHDVASSQAVMLYKTAGTQALDALLSSESLADLDSRIEFLGIAAAESTDELIEYGRLQLTIEAQHQELFDRKEELSEVRLTQTTIFAKLDEDHARLAADLAQLEETLGEEHSHEGDLAFAEAQITGELDAYYAKKNAEARGTSPQGFIWPLNGAITSYYGPRWGRMHTGIDIDGVTGDPIVASNSGSVVLASYYSGYGNAVVVDHGGGFATLYGHMSAFDVSVGDQVSRGDILGRVGCTGNCTGDHLHFEVRINGTPVNPLDYLP